MTSCTEVTIMNCSAMICSGLKIVVPLLWSNVVERTLACIYQNWQPSAMTLLTTTSVGRNRNSSEGSLRSPSSKRSWTSVGRNRNSSEGSLRFTLHHGTRVSYYAMLLTFPGLGLFLLLLPRVRREGRERCSRYLTSSMAPAGDT